MISAKGKKGEMSDIIPVEDVQQMLMLTSQEVAILKSQFVTSSWGGRRVAPYAFTEQGVAMLSGVLNLKLAGG